MKESDYLSENLKLIDDLKKMPLFAPFEDDHLRYLLQISKIRTYRAQESIIHEGNVDFWIYFLIYGAVKITKADKEITIIKRKGDVFGEMRFIDSTPRFASVKAIEDTACLAVDINYIDKLTDDDKAASRYILYRIASEILAERLREATERLIQLQEESGSEY